MRALVALALVAAPLAGCKREPVRPAGPCSADLSGTWRGESDARFRYRVKDQGSRVLLEPLFPIGGPGTPYGTFRTVVERKDKGVVRGTTETVYTDKGKTCPVRFAAEIADCQPGAFTLVGETHFDIKLDTCELIRTGAVSRARLVKEP